jgi:hypothetical protein
MSVASRLSPTFDPRLELLLLEPPLEVVAFGFTGTPNEFTVNDADRLKNNNNNNYWKESKNNNNIN